MAKRPSAAGAAKQWVREKFPNEIKVYRQRRTRAPTCGSYFVHVPKDNKTPFRTHDEAVAILVPKSNIGT